MWVLVLRRRGRNRNELSCCPVHRFVHHLVQLGDRQEGPLPRAGVLDESHDAEVEEALGAVLDVVDSVVATQEAQQVVRSEYLTSSREPEARTGGDHARRQVGGVGLAG